MAGWAGVGGDGVLDLSDHVGLEVAVLVPCYNEAASIAQVVTDFRSVLPTATVHVYDNNSDDGTADVARAAGAFVRTVARRGKGNVIRRMFADIEADVYLMVDGDDTYDPAAAPEIVRGVIDAGQDMVVGARATRAEDKLAYRRGHTLGNAVFTRAVKALFGGGFTDVFSGYRAMSKRFVKSLPIRSEGFEIEAELSAHAVEVGAACSEVTVEYRHRGDDSASKLNTYRDGFRIAAMLVKLYEEMKPFPFFGVLALALTLLAFGLGLPVVVEFAHTGIVARYPTAILAASVQVIAVLFFFAGLILRSVGLTKGDIRRSVYLQIPSLPSDVPVSGRARAQRVSPSPQR